MNTTAFHTELGRRLGDPQKILCADIQSAGSRVVVEVDGRPAESRPTELLAQLQSQHQSIPFVFFSVSAVPENVNSVLVANLAVCLYSSPMIVYLHRLRDRGWPIPKYQMAFKNTVEGALTMHEERDTVLNRHTRIARLQSSAGATKLDVPPLLDAILVELTAERLVLSGIERHEDVAIARIEDVAQTWVCWFNRHT